MVAWFFCLAGGRGQAGLGGGRGLLLSLAGPPSSPGDPQGLANHQQHQPDEGRLQGVLVRADGRVTVLVQGRGGEWQLGGAVNGCCPHSLPLGGALSTYCGFGKGGLSAPVIRMVSARSEGCAKGSVPPIPAPHNPLWGQA